MIFEKTYLPLLRIYGGDKLVIGYLAHRMFNSRIGNKAFQDYYFKTIEEFRLSKSQSEFDEIFDILKEETIESINKTNKEIREIIIDYKKLNRTKNKLNNS